MCSIVSRVSGCWTKGTWTACSGPKRRRLSLPSAPRRSSSAAMRWTRKRGLPWWTHRFAWATARCTCACPTSTAMTCSELQKALSALGFACGDTDGIFGAFTELALRKFQTEPGSALRRHSRRLHLCRASATCTIRGRARRRLHGYRLIWGSPVRPTCSNATRCACSAPQEFTRSVASRMSQLGACHQPRIEDRKRRTTCSLHPISTCCSCISCCRRSKRGTVCSSRGVRRRGDAVHASGNGASRRRMLKPTRRALPLELPGSMWEDAGVGRSAQHFAIARCDGAAVHGAREALTAASEKKHCQRAVLGAARLRHAGRGRAIGLCSPQGAVTALL